MPNLDPDVESQKALPDICGLPPLDLAQQEGKAKAVKQADGGGDREGAPRAKGWRTNYLTDDELGVVQPASDVAQTLGDERGHRRACCCGAQVRSCFAAMRTVISSLFTFQTIKS